MPNDFWTSANIEPKRKYRFLVQFTGQGTDLGELWFAKTATKPEVSVSTLEHNYLNHKFYYPGSVEWSTVSIDLVDPVSPDAATEMAKILTASGYAGPKQLKDPNPETISKGKSVASLGHVKITQIDGDGNQLEEWTLNNAFITKVAYGDLAYGDDELSVISLELRYDWATLQAGVGSSQYWQT